MDLPTRTIFRSWNWPVDEGDRFSHRPTPNRISKVSFISPGRIYRSWNNLFDNGYVRKVIFLPSESIIPKSNVVIPNGTYGEFQELKRKVDDLAFIEAVHFGRIYASSGSFSSFFSPGSTTISISFTGASGKDAEKMTRMIISENSRKIICLPHYSTNQDVHNARDLQIVKEMAYRSIYDVNVRSIADKLGLNSRTARRKMDRVISEREVFAYPLLNQLAIKGFNIFMVLIDHPMETDQFSSMLKEGILGERYLLFMRIGKMQAAMFYYENLGEMDHLLSEIEARCQNCAVITRFDSAVRNP